KSRELRERGARLSIDGMGVSGRIGLKELEMNNLLAAQFEMNRNASDAAAAYGAAMAQVNEGADLPSVQAKISEDATVQALRTDLNRQDMLISGLQGYGQQYRALMSAKATRDDMQR